MNKNGFKASRAAQQAPINGRVSCFEMGCNDFEKRIIIEE
jgi:hypothetical protein